MNRRHDDMSPSKALLWLVTAFAFAFAMFGFIRETEAQQYRSSPNVSGGYNYFHGSRPIGRSSRSVTGGLNYNMYGYGYGYGCCYNRPFAEGHQIGRDIVTIFRALSGNGRRANQAPASTWAE